MIRRPGKISPRTLIRGLTAALGLAVLVACTRGTIPIISGGAVLPSTLTAAAGVTRTPIYLFTPGPGYQFPHAVFGVPRGGTLTVRQVAGVSGGELAELAYNLRGLALTGNATSLGTSTWVEIVRPSGGAGWVPAGNLTQDVPTDAFCGDPRVLALLDVFRTSLVAGDAVGVQAVVSPRRGLTVRFDWRSPEVTYRPSQIADLLRSDEAREWGSQFSGAPIVGSFREVILPRLQAISVGEVSLACGEVLTGLTLREVMWPSEYANLNFYSIFRAGDPSGSEFAWTTWLVGIEYIDNQPYISHLVQLRAGI